MVLALCLHTVESGRFAPLPFDDIFSPYNLKVGWYSLCEGPEWMVDDW